MLIIVPRGQEIGPAGLEPTTEAKNRRKGAVKIRRNPLIHFLSMIPNIFKDFLKLYKKFHRQKAVMIAKKCI